MNKETSTQSKIKETDVVSGRLYLKLIKDFKEHEQHLKDLISAQRDKIVQLKEIIDAVGKEDSKEKAIINLKLKLDNFKRICKEKDKSISKLKIEKERLFHENVMLREQLKNYQQSKLADEFVIPGVSADSSIHGFEEGVFHLWERTLAKLKGR